MPFPIHPHMLRLPFFLALVAVAAGQLGWTNGRNVRIDTRWAGANAAEVRRHAAELAALAPDVILAHGGSTVGPLLQATRTVPIVFPVAGDPVGAGLVDNLARPGGNATGFMEFEYSLGGKWLELLKQIAPSVTRAAVLRDPSQGSATGQFAAIQAVAPSLRVEVTPVGLRDTGDIERAVSAFARSPNGGLIVTAGAATVRHSNLIITLAGRHKLPAVYNERSFIAAGGLISYGPDFVDMYRQAAGYVDRILKGGGQIIDASIVPVPTQRNSRDENNQLRAGRTPAGWKQKPAKLRRRTAMRAGPRSMAAASSATRTM